MDTILQHKRIYLDHASSTPVDEVVLDTLATTQA